MKEKKRFPSDKQEQYIVRFPEGMREKIKRSAEENGRSMNAEIVSRLQKSISGSIYSPDQEDTIKMLLAEQKRLIKIAEEAEEKSLQSHTEADRRALLWGKPVENPDAYSPGTYGCHEAFHMSSVSMNIIDSQLMQHPAILLNKKYYALAEKAFKALLDLHQAIGTDHLN